MLEDTRVPHYRHHWLQQCLMWQGFFFLCAMGRWPLHCRGATTATIWSKSYLYLTYFIFGDASQILSLWMFRFFFCDSLLLTHVFAVRPCILTNTSTYVRIYIWVSEKLYYTKSRHFYIECIFIFHYFPHSIHTSQWKHDFKKFVRNFFYIFEEYVFLLSC